MYNDIMFTGTHLLPFNIPRNTILGQAIKTSINAKLIKLFFLGTYTPLYSPTKRIIKLIEF